ncbi:MAG: hypothetical protein LBT27_01540 [Prevotellaceae bacterium]|jgi:hypothetical protein|nr:hypothetical protein [Prevotellaceae bacterium]
MQTAKLIKEISQLPLSEQFLVIEEALKSIKNRQCELLDNTHFEQDWANAISGEELVKRVHNHIDTLYANAEH